MLTEDSMDDDFYINSLIQEKEWLDKFRKKLNGSHFSNYKRNEQSKKNIFFYVFNNSFPP